MRKDLKMRKIAVPLNNAMDFYHSNLVTAPKFAIYTIDMKKKNVTFTLDHMLDNPLNSTNGGQYNNSQIQCSCDKKTCSDLHHRAEHYIMLDAIHDCEYILVNYYCENVVRALKIANIQTYKISPFITKVDMAIKNFLLGVSLASTYKHIHHVS